MYLTLNSRVFLVKRRLKSFLKLIKNLSKLNFFKNKKYERFFFVKLTVNVVGQFHFSEKVKDEEREKKKRNKWKLEQMHADEKVKLMQLMEIFPLFSRTLVFFITIPITMDTHSMTVQWTQLVV